MSYMITCPCCGWVSSFPKEFIDEYKKEMEAI